jgi:hypothetical protein
MSVYLSHAYVRDQPRFLASLSVQAKIQAGSESPKNC